MNLIWITSDTVRRKDVGCYGNKTIKTPAIDALEKKSVRFDRYYVASFPTAPARADFLTGRWTGCFMDWGPLPVGQVTLPNLLVQEGYNTAGVVDTPFYLRQNVMQQSPGEGMNYDQGFKTFIEIPGQSSLYYTLGGEGRTWLLESEHFAPRTFTAAGDWLEKHNHYKDKFFLYIDTWDPHEPYDAPYFYTEQYWPGYDGKMVEPCYGSWKKVAGYTEEKVKKAHAAYCGKLTMVDTWLGYFLKKVENLGLMENTAIIFTTDHGFYFGEHGGLFGKEEISKPGDMADVHHVKWVRSPIYEEIACIPLLIYIPGNRPGVCSGLTSAIDLMPTVLDILNVKIPDWVEGQSVLPMVKDKSRKGRKFVISGGPFTAPPDKNGEVPGRASHLLPGWDTTIITEEWSLLYSVKEPAQLYHLPSDPKQEKNVIKDHLEVAKEIHSYFVKFLKDNKTAENLVKPRLTLRLPNK
jgi:arylsulfatase A-like enzyme